MASTFTAELLNLEKIADGEQNNTWGASERGNQDAISRAIGGYLSKSVAGSSNVTLTQDESEERALEFTGAITANIEVRPVNAKEMHWVLYNNTSGAFTLTFVPSGASGVLIPQGSWVHVYGDGTNSIQSSPFLKTSNEILADTISEVTSANGVTIDGALIKDSLLQASFQTGAANSYINDSANANMTVGLTLNQGANDDEIFAVKSSDVAHTFTNLTEADTYGLIKKTVAGSGGLMIEAYQEGAQAMILAGHGDSEDTTHTSASTGCIQLRAYKSDGANGRTGVSATANAVVLSGGSTALFLIQGNGAIHATNVTGGQLDGTALDGEDDIGLVRVFERTVHRGMGIAMSKWDEHIQVNAEDLKRVGVLSSEGHFYNVQRMNSLLGGAIWQLNTMLQDTMERLASAERGLAAISGRAG